MRDTASIVACIEVMNIYFSWKTARRQDFFSFVTSTKMPFSRAELFCLLLCYKSVDWSCQRLWLRGEVAFLLKQCNNLPSDREVSAQKLYLRMQSSGLLMRRASLSFNLRSVTGICFIKTTELVSSQSQAFFTVSGATWGAVCALKLFWACETKEINCCEGNINLIKEQVQEEQSVFWLETR